MLTLVGFFLDGDDASCRAGANIFNTKNQIIHAGMTSQFLIVSILAVSTEVLSIGKFIDGLIISFFLSGFLSNGVTDVFPLLFFCRSDCLMKFLHRVSP